MRSDSRDDFRSHLEYVSTIAGKKPYPVAICVVFRMLVSPIQKDRSPLRFSTRDKIIATSLTFSANQRAYIRVVIETASKSVFSSTVQQIRNPRFGRTNKQYYT